MKRILFSTLTTAAAALALIGAGRAMSPARAGGAGAMGAGSPQTRIYRRSRVPVPKPSMPSRMVSGPSRTSYPERDGTGARVTKAAASAPPAHHATVVKNPAIVQSIRTQERSEMTPNHYYWHNEGGLRYSHYYDGRNHWYGFYHGPTFYWTRYYGDHWWWYDGGGARWVFWWDGFWWWPGPGGAAFVYVGGSYYPYEDAGVTVEHEENQSPPEAVPAPNAAAAAKSPDGSRMVQLSASNGDAFLYDSTAVPPSFVKFLGTGASKVRFSGGGTAAAPLHILVEYKDNTFALFDTEGNSQSSAVKAAEPAAPPLAKPDSIPPMPTSAPGQ